MPRWLGRFEMGDNRRPRGWLDITSNLLQSIRRFSSQAAWVHTGGVRVCRFVRAHLRYSFHRAKMGERGLTPPVAVKVGNCHCLETQQERCSKRQKARDHVPFARVPPVISYARCVKAMPTDQF